MDPATLLIATAAATTALKDTFNAAKSLVSLTNDANIKVAVFDLLTKIGEQQEKHNALLVEQGNLIMEFNALKDEVAKLRKHKVEVSRYKLAEVVAGFSVYVPKLADDSGEQPHLACPRCMAKGMVMSMEGEPCEWTEGRPQVILKCIDCGYGRTIGSADYERFLRRS